MRAEDHLEVLSIAPRYAAAVDARDLARAAALFVPDGLLAVPRPPRELAPLHVHRGREAIAAALAHVASVDLTVHEVVGQVIEAGPTDDVVTGHIRCVAHHVTGEQDVVWRLHYDDRYVRTPGGWQIARRALHLDLIELRHVQPRQPASVSATHQASD